MRLVPESEKQLAPRQELLHSRTAGAERVNLCTTKPKIIRKCLLVVSSYGTGTTFFIARVWFQFSFRRMSAESKRDLMGE